ncbi:MAG: glycosyltransferase [Sphingobacteriales bacterium]|nr:glycosyltransferase [Sphingobacteriales bacterium]
MNHNHNILFIAFEFPPLSSGGVQRSLKFVKYLPDFGINPIVVTVRESDYPAVLKQYKLDNNLIEDLPSGTIIERLPCRAIPADANVWSGWLRIYFSVTEIFDKTWRQPLEQALPKLIKKYNPQAIYLTIPPFAMVPLWDRLLTKIDIPLIIDFRDAWSQWALAPNGTYWHYRLKLRMEESIIRKASAVICTTKETEADFKRLHSEAGKGKWAVIPNGYDGDFELPDTIVMDNASVIRICYVGNFYYSPEARNDIFRPWYKRKFNRILQYVPRKEDWLYRSPYFFFQSINKLFELYPQYQNKVQIHFAGHHQGWLQEQIDSLGLTGFCHLHGYLSHAEAINFQKEADVLLLTSAKVLNGRDYSIAGKTFEYFTMSKPILGFVCEGAQQSILEESGMALICNPDEPQQAAQQMHELFSGVTALKPNKNAIHKYQRKQLTEQLNVIIRKAIKLKSDRSI